MLKRVVLSIGAISIVLLLLVACQSESDSPSAAPAPAPTAAPAAPAPAAPTTAPAAPAPQTAAAESIDVIPSDSLTEDAVIELQAETINLVASSVPLQLPQKPSSEPKYGGKLTLVSNGSDFPRSWNMPERAYNNGFVTHWGELLTTFPKGPGTNPGDFSARPWLAKSWDVEDNGLTYVFHLQDGVRWASTPRVTVDETKDVTANDWVELAKLNFGLSESAYPSRFPEIDGPESWTALDDYTLEVKLNRPAASFLYKTRGLGPLFVGLQGYHEKMEKEGIPIEEAIQDWTTQVGTGPWILQDFTPDVSVAFVKNENYWKMDDQGNQLPYIEEMEVFKMQDERAQDAGFRTGKIGALGIETCGINTVRYEAINETNPDTQWEIFIDPSNARAVVPNFSNPDSPWQDVRVRRAAQLSIDKEGWVESVLGGWGLPFSTPISPGNTYWLPPGQYGDVDGDGIPGEKYLEYDVETAKQLMAEAGYEEGFEARWLLTHDQGNRFFSEGELIAESLRKIGIDLIVDIADGAARGAALKSGDWEAHYTFPGFGFDPSDWIFKGFHSLPNNQRYGDAGINDPELDTLIEAEESESDPARRYQKIADVQRYLQEKQYYIQAPKWVYINAVAPWLKNYQFHYSFHTGPGLAEAWIEK